MVFQTVSMDDVFDGCIFARSIVFAFEVVTEEPRKSLPHKCAEAAFEFLNHTKSCLVGLSVNEANQYDTFTHS